MDAQSGLWKTWLFLFPISNIGVSRDKLLSTDSSPSLKLIVPNEINESSAAFVSSAS